MSKRTACPNPNNLDGCLGKKSKQAKLCNYCRTQEYKYLDETNATKCKNPTNNPKCKGYTIFKSGLCKSCIARWSNVFTEVQEKQYKEEYSKRRTDNPHSEETRRKQSKSLKKYYKENGVTDKQLEVLQKVKPMKDSTKQKLREARARQIAAAPDKQWCNYNKEAIKWFDILSMWNGWNLQHAENGGEVYLFAIHRFLDASDSKNKVVVEFYENGHYDKTTGELNEETLQREQEIIELLNPTFIRIHARYKKIWMEQIN